ncbi:5'/3'-nucleotidase SurE [Rugosimonospora africana]|uniref:5'-nucleotidase n=1 Tax=Rugosimonospora africana TaxID=556532 RepID=A0A8J3VTG2_9ACTN|nr:5'/3'-nucleotidase SurE [Rugosimonospora africana]GIH17636.1 5'/3'-nucleotidase SurE [Rugosimonospora africana]
MRALITNDDGIGAAGVRYLAIAARDAGLDVVVAAPSSEASGNSASIAVVEREGQVPVARHELDGLAGVPAFAVDAPPAFIVLIATRDAFGPPPDVVLSGVNRGSNTGRSVLHSGTVGAALTAVAHGRPGLAVSLDLAGEATGPAHWQTAAELATRLLPLLSDQFVLNLNVPNLSSQRIRGLREVRLASFGAVQTRITENGVDVVEASVAEAGEVPDPDTDTALVAAGFATVTALTPPREADVPPLVLPPYGG